MNAKELYLHAKNVLKGRSKDFEDHILKTKWNCWSEDHKYYSLYFKNIVKGRWEELENHIIKDIKVPKKGEGLSCNEWNIATDYCQQINKRCEELEEKILSLVENWGFDDIAINYCEKVIKGRWKELEEIVIAASVREGCFSARHGGYCYVERIIKGRWIEAEEFIKTYPQAAMPYAMNIIKGRWAEAEPYFLKNAGCALNYAKCVIKDRWIEAESILSEGCYEKSYKEFIRSKILNLLKEKDYDNALKYVDYKHFTNIIKNAEKKHHIPDILRNAMIATCITGNDQNSTSFFKQDKIFKEKMKNFLKDYKGLLVDDVIEKL